MSNKLDLDNASGGACTQINALISALKFGPSGNGAFDVFTKS